MTSPEVKLFLNYQCLTDGAKVHHSYFSLNQDGLSLPSYNPQAELKTEERKGVFCGLMAEMVVPDIPDSTTHSTWNELV